MLFFFFFFGQFFLFFVFCFGDAAAAVLFPVSIILKSNRNRGKDKRGKKKSPVGISCDFEVCGNPKQRAFT